MKWNQIYSYEMDKKLIWTSHGVHMNFSWISYETKSNLITWIYMQFVLTVRMKYTWNSHEFRMIWTSSELHKYCMTSTIEVPMYYIWMWSLTSLLITSYEWASRSIVEKKWHQFFLRDVINHPCLFKRENRPLGPTLSGERKSVLISESCCWNKKEGLS